ncbi:hypothetical protein TNCV_3965001 [Trichonephila clavipes]|nr:hypothetical protein TNCV_3965001 [Trichonephila clavipes]
MESARYLLPPTEHNRMTPFRWRRIDRSEEGVLLWVPEPTWGGHGHRICVYGGQRPSSPCKRVPSQSENIPRMDFSVFSSDLNLLEHVSDMLGRRVAVRQPPPCMFTRTSESIV